jgi:hypothetical protein
MGTAIASDSATTPTISSTVCQSSAALSAEKTLAA